jgi:hypothetical protein
MATHRAGLRLLIAFAGAASLLLHGAAAARGDLFQPDPSATRASRLVAVSDDGVGTMWIQRMSVRRPWVFDRTLTVAGGDGVVRVFQGNVYAVNGDARMVHVIKGDQWQIIQQFEVGKDERPLDIAVVAADRAFVTREGAARLLRVNPTTGAFVESTDLGIFADSDGAPEMTTMALHGGRLFVALGRINQSTGGFEPPAMLAVVDPVTEQIIDADPARPGVQAIELLGKPPKGKMQVRGADRRLFVNATGGFFENGGIEAVNLAALATEGFFVDESDGQSGADIGSFFVTKAMAGFVVFSTDLLLSSHLLPFTVSGGVGPGPEIVVDLNYLSPVLAFDPPSGLLFMPVGGWNGQGVHVVDAANQVALALAPVATGGVPTDLALIPGHSSVLIPEHEAPLP